MTLPEDLPAIIYYKVGKMSQPSMPRRPVRYISSSGSTDAAIVCPTIPYGATGWMLSADTAWRHMNTLPARWLPFLNRERGTELDPRPKVRQ